RIPLRSIQATTAFANPQETSDHSIWGGTPPCQNVIHSPICMTANLTPGFLAIHSDRMENLRDTVFDWLRANPLQPLEQEVFLVQSNGVAEWIKVSMAEQLGVCSGIHVTLPARFLWDAYRAVLGPAQVPPRSAYDRQALTWRLMQLLPGLLDRPAFAPLKYF